MTVLNIATETVFLRDPSGRLKAPAGSNGDVQWEEVFSAFDTVRLIARTNAVPSLGGEPAMDASRIEILSLPLYRGVLNMIRTLPRLWIGLWRASNLDGAFLVRLPGPIGTFLALILAIRGRPYAAQVVGDPLDVLRGGDFGYFVKRLSALAVPLTRLAVRWAAHVNYVTAVTLQQRYPPGDDSNVFAVSDVVLPSEWFSGPRARRLSEAPHLFFCGSLQQRYKGLDLLIEAVTRLHERDFPVTATIAGDGVHRGAMEDLARYRGVSDAIAFLGAVPSEVVKAQLDRADLFVMPSRTEGLPRALLEAMARGLPAIGTKVGGIVELLPSERLVPPEDSAALADAIQALWLDSAAYARDSERGFRVARSYGDEVLRPMRMRFYRELACPLRCGSAPQTEPVP